MNELQTQTNQLPDTLPDLAKFVLVGREKLAAVRAEINAIQKVGLAKEVLEQKRVEAQEIAELVTLSEVKIGKMLREIPKVEHKGNQYTRKMETSTAVEESKPSTAPELPEWEMKNPNNSTPKLQEDASVPEWEEQHEADAPLTETVVEEGEGEQPDWSAEPEVELPKTKTEIIKELGFSKDQVSQFQKMAEHEDIVQEAIAEARAHDDIVSRTAVLKKITEEKLRPLKEAKNREVREAKQRHEEFTAAKESSVVSFADATQDREDKKLLSEEFMISLNKALMSIVVLRISNKTDSELDDLLISDFNPELTKTSILMVINSLNIIREAVERRC